MLFWEPVPYGVIVSAEDAEPILDDKVDVKVVLQPVRQGIDREVKYVAFVKKGQFYILLRKPEGMEGAGDIFLYDSKQIKLDYAKSREVF